MRWTPAILHSPAGERVRCDLCPHRCALAPGQVGACKVRRGAAGGMETATFATSVAHTDAVERKPFFHYRPGALALTLAAPGCSFRCDYCVNHPLSQYGREEGPAWEAAPVDVPEVVAAAAARGACVALSYSEPSLAVELTLALAEHGRAAGVEVVWKSNGFLTPEAIDVVTPALAAVNIDLKGLDEARHRRLTGAAAAPVLAAIRAFHQAGVWVEVSTPLVPGVSSSPEDLSAIAAAIADVDRDIPWHLLRFTPAYRMREENPTSPAELAAAVAIGRAAGLRHVYVERALGEEGRNTRCHGCGDTVVERGIWSLGANHLAAGDCPACGTSIAGRW
ncbi:AmmeMemoRadiSam system radical SAM enzyme [Nonomuraea africana]|uniref:AmmeMemoRadiSam system radical SAM enzyme n=1 Tax=Nonomuraea africana TaxID=46171 RepID=UPI0037AB9CD0